MSTMTAIALMLGGSGAALAAADAHFVPEATRTTWNGVFATVTFREEGVALDRDTTTISVKVTVDLEAVCTKGESTLHLTGSFTNLNVKDYPIGDDGIVKGASRVPLQGVKWNPEYTCVLKRVLLTATLDDFYTGATLVDRTQPGFPTLPGTARDSASHTPL